MAEKATPVTPDEADDIRVTLDLDNGSVECKIITIFDADHKDYIALLPLDKNATRMRAAKCICIAISRTRKVFRE